MTLEVKDVEHYHKVLIGYILQGKTCVDNEKLREDVLAIQPDTFDGIKQIIFEYIYSAYSKNIAFIPHHNIKAIKDHVREATENDDVRGNVQMFLREKLLEGYQYEHVFDIVFLNFNKQRANYLKQDMISKLEDVDDLQDLTQVVHESEQKLNKIIVPTYNTFDVERAKKHLLADYFERGIPTFNDEWNWRLSGSSKIGLEWDSYHVLTGATGSGKSCVAMQNSQMFMDKFNIPVCYFNLEIADHQFIKRWACLNSKSLGTYDCNKFILDDPRHSKKRLEFDYWVNDLYDRISKGKLFLYDNTYYKFGKIKEIIKYLASEKGVRVFIVDTLNRIKMEDQKDSEKYLYIGDISSNFETLAHEYNCIISGICQENIAGETKGVKDTDEVANTITRVIRVPAAECTKDIHTDEPIPTTLLKVKKARDGEVGTTMLYFDREHFKYYQPDECLDMYYSKRLKKIKELQYEKTDKQLTNTALN